MLTMSQALGPAQSSGLTLTAAAESGVNAAATPSAGSMPSMSRRGFTLTTVYRPASGSSVEEPPAAAWFPLPVPLLGDPPRVVHGVVPEGQCQQEGDHEDQQREELHQQREQHHGAAAWLPERQQLAGGARNVQRENEQPHHSQQKDRGLFWLAVVELTQAGDGGQPGSQPHTCPRLGRRHDLRRMRLDHGVGTGYRWNIR